MLVLSLKQNVGAQGFANLNFESANVSGYSPNSDVPTASALPGWSASFLNSSGTDVLTQVSYDRISLGGATISIIDSNAPVFGPLQGKYSAFLFGGPLGPTALVSAQISQTGMVPVGTESLLFDAQVSGAPFTVTLGGQTIAMALLQPSSNDTLYGGNIPSELAGQIEALTFTEPPAMGVQPSMFELDNIQFSASSVPEPSALGLTLLCGMLFAWRHYNKQKEKHDIDA